MTSSSGPILALQLSGVTSKVKRDDVKCKNFKEKFSKVVLLPRYRQGVKLPFADAAVMSFQGKVSLKRTQARAPLWLCRGGTSELQLPPALLWCCLHGPAAVMWCSGESDTCCQAEAVRLALRFRCVSTKQKLWIRLLIWNLIYFVRPAQKPIL